MSLIRQFGGSHSILESWRCEEKRYYCSRNSKRKGKRIITKRGFPYVRVLLIDVATGGEGNVDRACSVRDGGFSHHKQRSVES